MVSAQPAAGGGGAGVGDNRLPATDPADPHPPAAPHPNPICHLSPVFNLAPGLCQIHHTGFFTSFPHAHCCSPPPTQDCPPPPHLCLCLCLTWFLLYLTLTSFFFLSSQLLPTHSISRIQVRIRNCGGGRWGLCTRTCLYPFIAAGRSDRQSKQPRYGYARMDGRTDAERAGRRGYRRKKPH